MDGESTVCKCGHTIQTHDCLDKGACHLMDCKCKGFKKKKKTNSKQKGTMAEKQMVIILEKMGYNAIRSPRTMKRIFVKGRVMFVSGANDFFGLFDIIAKKKSYGNEFIQVKHEGSGGVREARAKIRRFMQEYGALSDRFSVAEKYPRKGFKIHYINEEGYEPLYVNLKGEYVEPFKEKVKNGKTV